MGETVVVDPLSIETFALVGIGGVFGALARYALTQSIPSQNFPIGTFLVNVIGSFILGAFTFSNSSSGVLLIVGVGICGSFTTFSTFSIETIRLIEEENLLYATINSIGTLIASLFAILIAWIVFF